MLKTRIIQVTGLFLFAGLLFTGCSKTEGPPASAVMSDYYPLVVGKWISYQLDSTVYVKLGTQKEVHSYVVQDIIDAITTDNLGNTAYRIRRMMRSNTDTTQWADNATFIVVPFRGSIEFTENNLKFIKLVNPVTELYTWNGNSYINTNDNLLRFYQNWEYFYQNVGDSMTLNGKTYPQTITVNQSDQVNGDPGNKNFFYAITRSYETYAKGVGLVYKDFLYEAWQPATNNYESNSYGIRLTILGTNF